jgi:multicomponent Na+:H+ antiporter subunit D
MNHQMLMASLILIPVIFGIVLYKLPLKLGKFVLLGVQSYLLALAVFLFLQTENYWQLYTILGGENPILNIVLRGDRLSLLLVIVTNFLFGIGFIYKITDKFFNGKMMLLYLILQGLTTGIFLTDDLFNLFILFEVSTVVTTLLLMFKKEGRVVYDALYYLITQMVSMMFFLFGIGFLYRLFGMLSISGIASLMHDAPASELILPFSFMMAGLCFKLGILPMHSWVSRAYGLNSAPITQLAVMSSIMMKTTLYWTFRFHDLFLPAFDYSRLFIFFAVATSIFAAIKAFSQKDICIMLA